MYFFRSLDPTFCLFESPNKYLVSDKHPEEIGTMKLTQTDLNVHDIKLCKIIYFSEKDNYQKN